MTYEFRNNKHFQSVEGCYAYVREQRCKSCFEQSSCSHSGASYETCFCAEFETRMMGELKKYFRLPSRA